MSTESDYETPLMLKIRFLRMPAWKQKLHLLTGGWFL